MHNRKRPGPFQTAASLILASGSPRRREFLETMGLEFTTVLSNSHEPPFPGGDPAEYALSMAESKGQAVARSHPGSWVISADTIVIIGGEVLGKPKTEKDAAAMLNRLSGRWHEVVSAFCVINLDGDAVYTNSVRSRVKIRRLSASEISSYIATGECMDKAGSYAVQGMGAFMVEKIDGSYTNVVGLPLSELVDAMESLGVIRPRMGLALGHT